MLKSTILTWILVTYWHSFYSVEESYFYQRYFSGTNKIDVYLHFLNLIDTAAVYRNEADIGNSLKQILPNHGLSRADIFITSKLCESFKHKLTICDILEMSNDF